MNLENNTYHLVPRFPQGRLRAFTMSYDDSVTTDVRLTELMRRFGVRGTFNIITGRLADEPRQYPKGSWGSLTAEQCLETYQTDMEMAVHTRHHFFLTRIPEAQALDEVLSDRKALEELTGRPVRGMAYPYAAHNDRVVELLRACGIVYARTAICTEGFAVPADWLRMPTTCHHNNPKLMELAEEFFRPAGRYGDLKLFYLWGHSYEFEKDDNWSVIENFLARIGGHSDVWYATNIEIFDYMQAYERLIWNVDHTVASNPTVQDVWLERHFPDNLSLNRVYHIPAGQTVQIG